MSIRHCAGPALLCVAAVLAGVFPVSAQEVQAEDPFLAQVNAELDQATAPADSETGANSPPPTQGTLYYLRVLSALCLVVALILAAGYGLRRAGRVTPLLAGPDLGRVLGRVHLSRNATLYFVETGGKVLVLAVSNTGTSTVAEFDASAFAGEEETEQEDFDPVSFLDQLRASTDAIRETAPPSEQDDDILALRRDIERLQGYLREESGGRGD